MSNFSLTRVLLLTLLLGASACKHGPTRPSELLEQLPRQLNASEKLVIASSNGFAFQLLEQVVARDRGANVFISPLSVSMALGMTLNGAAGTTHDQMRSASELADSASPRSTQRTAF